MEVIKLNKKSVEKAIEFLNSGGVVIFPTDTVYGFLADASNKKAVNKIYKIKKRPKSKPLPVFVKDFKMAKELAEINEKQAKFLKSKWPGRYTFLLSSLRGVPPAGGATWQSKKYIIKNNKIAIRIPKYKLLNDLLKKINKPLVQTSVNVSSEPALTKIGNIINQFGKKNVLIVDGGNLKKTKSSKILDLTGGKIKVIRL